MGEAAFAGSSPSSRKCPHYVALATRWAIRAGRPALLFCGPPCKREWHDDASTGQELLAALDACRNAAHAGSVLDTAHRPPAPALTCLTSANCKLTRFPLPGVTVLIGRPRRLQSLAFFVLLFLPGPADGSPEQPHTHADIGGVFDAVFGPECISSLHGGVGSTCFQLLGNLAWVTLAAGVMAHQRSG